MLKCVVSISTSGFMNLSDKGFKKGSYKISILLAQIQFSS